MTKRLAMWAGIVLLLLIIPLVLTIRDGNVEGVGWNWSPFDFIFMGILLFSAGAIFELIARKSNDVRYRVAVGLAVFAGLVLIWINAAVGIIGSEDNPANLMFGGVLAVGLIGSVIAKLQPRGMSYTSFAAAIVQAIVPVIALFISRNDFSPGVPQVFALNAVFVVMFVVVGILFWQASSKQI